MGALGLVVAKFDEDQPRADDGKWTSGGGGEGQGSSDSERAAAASARLASLPEAPEGYRHFDGFLKPGQPSPSQVRMKDVGLKGMGSLYGLPVNPDKFVAVQELDPANVHYTQSAVIREAVARKLAGEDTTFGGIKAELPLVIKHGDDYHLQDGNHRAAADVLRTGKLHARVLEIEIKPRGKKPTWRSPGPVKKMSEAVEVENIDKAGEDAFLRLSSGLPTLAGRFASLSKAAAELGEDLVVLPPVSTSEPLTLEKAAADLALLEKVLSPEDASRARRLRAQMIGLAGLEKYDEDQPRDDEGKWTSGGGEAGSAPASSAFDPHSDKFKDRLAHASAQNALAATGSVPKAIQYLRDRKVSSARSAQEEIRRDYGGKPDPETKAFFERMVQERHEEMDRAIAVLEARAKTKKDDAAPTTGGDVSTADLATDGGALVPAQGSKKKPKKLTEEHPAEQPGVLPQYRELNLGTEVALALRDKAAGTPAPKKKPNDKHLFPADVGSQTAASAAAGEGTATVGVSMRELSPEELEKRRRAEMPQIPAEKLGEFVTFLRDERGVAVEPATVSISDLKSSQDDLNKAKVARIKEQGLEKLLAGPELLTASGEGSEHAILDGHHRAAAIRELDPNAKVRVLSVQTTIENAIAHAHAFPHAEVRGIRDGSVEKFDESEPRDDSGKWTSGGGAGSSTWDPAEKDPRYPDSTTFEKSLDSYSKQALGDYTNVSHRDVNAALHEAFGPGGKALDGIPSKLEPAILAIDTATQHEFAEPVTVFRGVRGGHAEIEKYASSGEPFRLNGFQSTSTVPEVAAKFSDLGRHEGKKDNTILSIKTPRGAPVRGLSDSPGENEILLGHGWKYKVDGVDEKSIRTPDGPTRKIRVINLSVVSTEWEPDAKPAGTAATTKKGEKPAASRFAEDLDEALVPDPAPVKKLAARLVLKRAKAEDLEEGDEEERTVFGIVLEPETVDSQGDIYDEDTIRETAWRFAERYQHFGLMHRQIVPGIVLLETYLAPIDFEIIDRKGQAQQIRKGTWLLRVRVMDDSIWEAVKAGRLDGFSIGGSAVRQPLKQPKKRPAA